MGNGMTSPRTRTLEPFSVDGLHQLYAAMGKADLTIPEMLELLERRPKTLKAMLRAVTVTR